MKFSFQSKHFITAGLAILISLTAIGLEYAGFFKMFELKSYDLHFAVKSHIQPSKVYAPIVLIVVDDQTMNSPTFRKPMMLWYKNFTQVIDSLVNNDARAVGFDYMLPDVLFDDYLPGYSQTWLKTLFHAKRKQVPFITGYMELTERTIMPHKNYLMIIEPSNLGVFNLTPDQDDYIRRQRLWFDDRLTDKKINTFGYAVAKAFDPAIKLATDTVYIDFVSGSAPFPMFSFDEVYEKAAQNDLEFMRKHFKDKIVLLGSINIRRQDRYLTPLSNILKTAFQKTAGVEIHAHIIDTLLARHFFAELSFALKYAIYLFIALIISFVVMSGGKWLIIITLPLLGMMLTGGSVTAFLYYQIFPYVPTVFVLISGSGLTFFYRFFIFNRERRKLQNLFERYLPPEIVKKLLAANDDDFFVGKNKCLCILFSDIRNFTSFSEQKTPQEIVARLNEYFDAMAAEVTTQKGIVDKFIGDGMLAFFGVLESDDNPSMSGVRCAMNMMNRLDALNEIWKSRGEEPFKIGIGLHTGIVMLGNIGSTNKTEFTVIGDVVNLASRLENMTKTLDASILISETVHHDLQGLIETEEKGMMTIRGRSPEKTYQLLGLKN